MGKRIIAMFMAIAMVIALPVFSFAADTKAVNSGSTMAVMNRAVAMTAANENIALAASADETGKYGWNIEDISPDFVVYDDLDNRCAVSFVYLDMPIGHYELKYRFDNTDFRGWNVGLCRRNGANYQTISSVRSIDDNIVSFSFDLDSPANFRVGLSYNLDVLSDSGLIRFSYEPSFLMTPVPGISSGYTYSGTFTREERSEFGLMDFSFGEQPSGKYLINIYHWGDSYDVNFHVSTLEPESDDMYFPIVESDGVASFVYNHSGGDMSFDGSFSIVNTDTTAADGQLYGGGTAGTFGDVNFWGPLSWTFQIIDIVAIPYDEAGDHNFGPFSLIIGFFRDSFSSLTSSISVFFADLKQTLIDLFSSDEAEKDVEDAQTELDKEVAELDELSQDLGTYAGNIESQMQSDFAVSDEIMYQTDNAQLIWSGLFTSFGMWTIFFWLPPLLAVIRYVLRL